MIRKSHFTFHPFEGAADTCTLCANERGHYCHGNAEMRRDKERHLLIQALPVMRRMLRSSGPWLACPFCGGDDASFKDERDQTAYHRDDCVLRTAEELR